MSGSKSSTDFCARRFRRLGHKDVASFARDQRLGDLCGAEHEIDRAGCDGAARHAVIVGFADVLRDDEAAFLLDRFQAKAAVGAGSGKDHADGARSIFASQRIQQEVERQPRAVSRLRLRKPQRALVVDREIDARRNDIDALAFDRHSVGRQQDRHRRMAGKQIHHHAVVARVEVLHDDEGHAVDRPAARPEASCRRQGRRPRRRSRRSENPRGCWRRGASNPTRSLRLGLMRRLPGILRFFSKSNAPTERARINSKIPERLRPISSAGDSSASLEREPEGMSSFRIFPRGETSIIVASASPQPKVSRRWETWPS